MLPEDALWYGLFPDEDMETDESLEELIEMQHVTFGFKKKLPEDLPWGTEFDVLFVGYGNDGINEGYAVELPRELDDWYQGAEQPHMTVSVSPDGKPVDTAFLEFELLDEPFSVPMRFGCYGRGAYYFG